MREDLKSENFVYIEADSQPKIKIGSKKIDSEVMKGKYIRIKLVQNNIHNKLKLISYHMAK